MSEQFSAQQIKAGAAGTGECSKCGARKYYVPRYGKCYSCGFEIRDVENAWINIVQPGFE